MSRFKPHALTSLAVVYLLSLWVFQLPDSGVERFLAAVFRPVQKIMHTDRLYRMYAPDPRAVKRMPFLELRTERSPVRFLKSLPGSGDRWGLLGVFSKEKWANFLDSLSKAVRGERFFLTQDEGERAFRKLAEKICRLESSEGDAVLSVALKSRRVEYGEFKGDIVWGQPETGDSFPCP
ncbi:MAG TPA: hypothetical protein VFX30_08960 [bacterium]|nr:hypothetical protein [bacterium]